MRVLIYNNYDMRYSIDRVERGEYPSHHVLGALALRARGWDVDLLGTEANERLSRWTAPRVGDLDLQLRAFRARRRHDVVVSGTEYDSVVLGLLHRLGLYRPAVVAVVHGPPRPPFTWAPLCRLAFSGHDVLLFHSEAVRRLFVAAGVREERTRRLEWGCDLSFYDWAPYEAPTDRRPYVLAAGKTRRDYTTLVRAVEGLDLDLRVFCSTTSAPSVDRLAPNVHVAFDDRVADQSVVLDEHELQAQYRGCLAVAVPLAPAPALAGLTNLLEAMAMGRAVVVTRNPLFDVDVEREGIGLVVEPGDVGGWRRALARLAADPVEAAAMGRRARALAEVTYNGDRFDEVMVGAVEAARARAHRRGR